MANKLAAVLSTLRRVAIGLAAFLLAAYGPIAGASGAPDTEPANADPAAAAISQLVARNGSLHDYSFDVAVHVALLTFPWIRFSMSGHGQYTRDGAYTVHFDHVPWFGHGFETISMASLDPKNWPQEYTIALGQPQGDDVILTMHDRKKSPLNEALVTIDGDQSVRQILWNYSNGGHVRLSIVPVNVSGYALPSAEQAEIVMTGYRAMADATFSNYRVNAVTATASSRAESGHEATPAETPTPRRFAPRRQGCDAASACDPSTF